MHTAYSLLARVATVILLLLGSVLPALAAAKPNVIVILSDDQGYGDFSINGNPVLKTPNLDALARQSVRLTDYHVAPMCTPTRGQLMTGVDACRSGATSVCAGRSFVRPNIPMMPEMFAKAGYKTAIFGKWHLGDSYPNLPNPRGFQEAVYHLGWGITSMADTWCNDYFDGRFHHNGKSLEKHPGYCTDVWFNLSLDWIKQRKAADEPFLLYLPTNAPHGPHWVADKYKQMYAKTGAPAAFFGMIANLDENVGRLTKYLDDSGLADNTILIFFNDNGGTAGVNTFNAGMRGRKTQYYDGGHRAACFIRWPGGKLAPREIDDLAEVQDLLPTLLDLCGVKKPSAAKVDGISLAPVLRGESKPQQLTERILVVQYGQKPEKFDSAVMHQKWRLVKGAELYDIKSDPGQKNDVASAHPEIVKRLRDHYEKWWSEVEPLLAQPVPIIIGDDHENPVTLSAADWWNVYCDNMNDLRSGKPTNSNWTVKAAKDGDYEIALRRWPKEADAAITAGVPAFKAVDGGLPEGKALPIASIRLTIGNQFDQKQPVPANAKEVVFKLPLKAGTPLAMQSYCYDSAGKELCGAYFAYVTRK
jgi:arylsulfatase A-like enzyme